MQSPVQTTQGCLQPLRWGGGWGPSAAAVRRRLLTLRRGRFFISQPLPLAFPITGAFWFCPECLINKRWENQAARPTAARGAEQRRRALTLP